MNNIKLKRYRRKRGCPILSGESYRPPALVAPNLKCRFRDHLNETVHANIRESIFPNCKAL